jgi:hypothetical protein
MKLGRVARNSVVILEVVNFSRTALVMEFYTRWFGCKKTHPSFATILIHVHEVLTKIT